MANAIDTVAVLAGGLAKRMRPLTETVPKAMLAVNGEPFVAHQLRLLRREGLRRVVLCLGYLGEQIADFVGDGSAFGLAVDYSFDGDRPLGTGGALRKALPLLGDRFFVVYGDSYLDTPYAPIAAAFVESGKPELMTVFRNEGRWDTSNVVFRDGVIVRHSKTHKSEDMLYIDYGLGILKSSVLGRIEPDRVLDLSAVYSTLAETGELAGYEVRTRFYEIGSPEGLRQTADYIGRATGFD